MRYAFPPPALYPELPQKMLSSGCKLVLVVFAWFQHAMPRDTWRCLERCMVRHMYLGPAAHCLEPGPLWDPAAQLPAARMQALVLDCSRAYR
jgi:hypothetical protein